MKENKYDDPRFFSRYSQMTRSVKGLDGAGEWHELRRMLPDFQGKRVLDLGCGFGWHCQYAAQHGAHSAIGVDLSRKMIEEARKKNLFPNVSYHCTAIEDFEFQKSVFDIVISSLVFHYLESFDLICQKVCYALSPGGSFVFSVEHPVFTAYGNQDWFYDEKGEKLHWPVDRYFTEGKRQARFLGEEVIKYHKTLTTYTEGLLQNGFAITGLCEPQPDTAMLETIPGMYDEQRRPMMLILAARKTGH